MMSNIARFFVFCAALTVSVSAFGQEGGRPNRLTSITNSLSKVAVSTSHQLEVHHGCRSTEMNMIQLAGPLVPGIVSLYALTVADKKKDYLKEVQSEVSEDERERLNRVVAALEAQIAAQEARAKAYGTQDVIDATNKNIKKFENDLDQTRKEIDNLDSPMAKNIVLAKSIIHKIFFPWLGMVVTES